MTDKFFEAAFAAWFFAAPLAIANIVRLDSMWPVLL